MKFLNVIDRGEKMMDYAALIRPFKDLPGGLIQAYHAVQKEMNYLPEEAIKTAAEIFNLSVNEAYGVATYYSYFSVKPRGKYVIRICESAPCHIAGAAEVIAALEKELNIRVGETTADGRFTLELTQCVGHCQDTPVITVNCQPFQAETPDKIAGILAKFR